MDGRVEGYSQIGTKLWFEACSRCFASHGDTAIRILCENPIIINPFLLMPIVSYHETSFSWERLLNHIVDLGSKDATAEKWLGGPYLAASTAMQVEKGDLPFTVGFGPIEKLAERIEKSEVAEDYAMQFAQQPELMFHMAPTYVRRLSHYCLSNSWPPTSYDEVKRLYRVHRLLESSVRASVTFFGYPMQLNQIALDRIEIAHMLLMDHADSVVYADAISLGREMVQGREPSTHDREIGELLHRLGTLHLDPFFVHRSIDGYEAEDKNWRRFLGAQPVYPGIDSTSFPSPREALDLAIMHFREALPLRSGILKGQTLKALAQALTYQPLFGVGPREEEINQLCHEALQLLDPKQDAADIATVHQILGGGVDLSRRSEEVSNHKSTTTLDMNKTEVFRRLEAELINTPFVVKDNPLAPFEELNSICNEVRRLGNERLQKQLYDAMLRRIFIYSPSFNLKKVPFKVNPQMPFDYAETILELETQLKDMPDRDPKLAAAYIHLASFTRDHDEESVGLEFLTRACRIPCPLLECTSEAIEYLHALLHVGLSATLIRSQRLLEAVNPIFSAMQQFEQLKLTSDVSDCLDRLCTLGIIGTESTIRAIIRRLPEFILRIDLLLDECARKQVRHLCDVAVAKAGNEFTPDDLLLATQMRKGVRYAASYLSHLSRRSSVIDSEAAARLFEIQQLEKALPSSTLRPDISSSTLTNIYIERDKTPTSGSTAGERLVNLEFALDRYLDDRTLPSPDEAPPRYLSGQEILNCLGERTVLLIFQFGVATENLSEPGLYVIRIHRPGHLHTFRTHMTGGQVEIQYNLGKASFSGIVLQGLRDLLLENVNDETEAAVQQRLKEDFDLLLGLLADDLKSLHDRGFDHLCIVPHESLHYYPLHLLRHDSFCLGTQWKVTYLPNLALLKTMSRGSSVDPKAISLDPRDRGEQGRESLITAIGLGFDGRGTRRTDPDIRDAREEAARISEIFQVHPLLDREVTRDAFIKALKSSRYVHIATHSFHNMHAPSFQTLSLDQEEFYAFDLLDLDLRGLEVVTLGACDTALGRFDQGDNLRGLMANLFRAGVQTIISTLWPVDDSVAKVFFISFYRSLHDGHTKIDAYWFAQEQTRHSFPAYVDWGAFCLYGCWL